MVVVKFNEIEWDGTKMKGKSFEVKDKVDVEEIISMARKAVQKLDYGVRYDYLKALREFRKFMMAFWEAKESKKARDWLDVDNAEISIYRMDINVVLPIKTKNLSGGYVIPGEILEPFWKTWGNKFDIVPGKDIIAIYGGVKE